MSEEPSLHIFQGSGARIAWFEWGDPDAQPVLMIHATGFHARCWDKVVDALPRGFRIVAPDTRGHGRSERTGHMTDWSLAAKDVGEMIAHLDLKHIVGVGHSKGGHTLVQVAAAQPQRFARLLLVDPVMLAPEMYARLRSETTPKEHPVARRRNSWHSWEEMYEHFRKRPPYSLWRPDMLADYCRFGLVEKANGSGLELACPPEIEASIYLGSTSFDIYDRAKSIDVPVTVLRAKPRAQNDNPMDFASSPTWEKAASAFPRGRDVFLPHLTHFIPMQDPGLVARFIADPEETSFTPVRSEP
jgi:pimeloyl-ACP methyl ester carboxylesterase